MTTPRSMHLEDELVSPRFARAVGLLLFGTILALVTGHFLVFFVMQAPPVSVKFSLNLEGEGNLTAWVGSLMLLAASAGAFLVFWLLRNRVDPGPLGSAERRGWLVAGVVFLYLATDEAAMIHDVFASVLANRLPELFPSLAKTSLWNAWILVFVVLGVLALILLFSLLHRTLFHDRVATLFVATGVLCFMLNPVLEIMENRLVDLLPMEFSRNPQALIHFNPRAWYELQGLIIIEECMEMASATCFLLGFLNHGRHVLSRQRAAVMERNDG